MTELVGFRDREGVDIIDEEGQVRGRSVAAGRQSLLQVALTRVAIPMPSENSSLSLVVVQSFSHKRSLVLLQFCCYRRTYLKA